MATSSRNLVNGISLTLFDALSYNRYTYGIDPVNMITKETDNFEVDWEEKKNLIFWRGATTGGGSSPPGFLHQYQRHRCVVLLSKLCSTEY